MSVLSRFFGKKAAPQKPRQEKAASLDTLSPEALIAIALAESQTEGSEQTRLSAIQKVKDEQTLRKIAFGSSSQPAQRAAKKQLAALIDSKDLSFEQLRANHAEPMALFEILSLSQQPEKLEQLLAAETDADLLFKVALKGGTVKLRQIAAQKINDKDHLAQLLKDSKGKDKTVYKIVKEKCDVFKEQERQRAATQAAIEASVQALEQHSHRPLDPQFTAKFHHLQQQWQALAETASEDLRLQAQHAIDRCQATIDAVANAQAEEAAHQQALSSADQHRHEVLQSLSQLAKRAASDELLTDDIAAQLSALTNQWAAALEQKPAPAHEQKSYKKVTDTLAMLQDQQQQYGTLQAHLQTFINATSASGEAENPESASIFRTLAQRLRARDLFSEGELPATFQEAQVALDQWDKARNEKKSALQNTQRHIGGLIRKAKDAVQTGRLKQAAGLRRAIDEKAALLGELPSQLQNQLQQLDEDLEKLQDWKDYAVLPKKHDLIAQMKSLLDSQEHPEALALKIKRLQDDWKALSKGGGIHKEGQDQDQELWEEFHEYAQTAFQPCRDYFAEQAVIREKNLENCKVLVEQVKTYHQNYDWDNAQWKDVEKVVRVARQEWRNYTPTERAATAPVLKEFEETLAQIEQKLDQEREKNRQLKQQFISEAKDLLALPDQRQAVDQAKRLQASWQQVGVTARSVDQKLWREFRAACDAVFAKKQQQSAEFKEELEANLSRAQAIIAELKTLTQESGQALMEARGKVDTLRQAFNDAGMLPKAKSQEVTAEFMQTIEVFEQKIRAERQAAKQQVWHNLFAANDLARRCQLVLLTTADSEEAQGLVTDANEKIAAINPLPGGGLKAVQQKLVLPLVTDVEENLLALRMLCVRAEVLCGLSTPAADQPLRMAYQVKQLEQNFGQKPGDPKVEMESLVFEWIAVGPVETADYEPLFQRFDQCRMALSQ